ncbi:SOS response-associated peptidase [Sphingobacteriaceae bacterium AH-315-L07]|nr:SOS response-associated peptidase [Sphingobacteriaceae bacterium AH-315-L07]
MCYDVQYYTRKKEEYAERFGLTSEQSESILNWLTNNNSSHIPVYHSNAFSHPYLPVVYNDGRFNVGWFYWGLIPSWIKDSHNAVQISNKTLNARGETIFEKPSFRNSAKNKRCVIMLDAFFEHHHANDLVIPFRISMPDQMPFGVAGLWSQWDSQDRCINSVTIVTTTGNELMSNIHNNPKLPEPRMPVIITQENQATWLDVNTAKSELKQIITPFNGQLNSYTVQKLRGKVALGNIPEVLNNMDYKIDL